MTFGQFNDLGTVGRSLANGFSDLAPISDVVEDALVLIAATVRLRVKNRLVVRALRDGDDYDEEWLLMAAALEYVALAAEKELDLLRLEGELRAARTKRGKGEHPSDYRSIDVSTLKRRRKTVRRLARRLQARSEEFDPLRVLVAEAKQDALDEIAVAIRGASIPARSGAAISPALPPPDRAAALAALLLDLAELAAPSSQAGSRAEPRLSKRPS